VANAKDIANIIPPKAARIINNINTLTIGDCITCSFMFYLKQKTKKRKKKKKKKNELI
jgi:hypothetical protein